jgi:hypothetical protein
MARIARAFCLLPASATPEDTHSEKLHCGVGGHPHLSFTEVYGTAIPRQEAEKEVRRRGAAFRGCGGLLESGEIRWLCFPKVLQLTASLEAPVPVMMASSVSARHGQYVAAELARTSAYAARNFPDPVSGLRAPEGRGCSALEVPGGPLGEPMQGRLALAWPHLFVDQVSTRKRF